MVLQLTLVTSVPIGNNAKARENAATDQKKLMMFSENDSFVWKITKGISLHTSAAAVCSSFRTQSVIKKKKTF